MQRNKIKYDNIVDLFFWLTLLLFSAHDLTTRLFNIIPWRSFEILSFLIFITLTIISKKRFNFRLIPFMLLFYFLIVISILFGNDIQNSYIKSLFFSFPFTLRIWVYLILFSQMDYKKIKNGLLYVAYINMILLVITTIHGLYSSVGRDTNYLGIGLTGVVWIPIIMQSIFIKDKSRKEKFIHILSTIIFCIFTIIYGNRGSVLAIFLFLIYCLLKYTSMKKKVLLALFIMTLLFIFYNNMEVIIKLTLDLIESIGISSRNLKLLLSNQITYTTHRTDQIWVNIFNSIKENWIFGHGLCYDRVINGGIDSYAHNLVLEVWLSFGIIFGSLLLLIYFIKGIKICFSKKNQELSSLIAPFYISSTAVLMFNNSFCQFGFFWIFFGILLSYSKEIKKTGGITNENINIRSIRTTWSSRGTKNN